MDLESRRMYDDLQIRLKTIEAEETRILEDLDRVRAEKKRVLVQMGQYTDEKFEADALALLYEQRRGRK